MAAQSLIARDSTDGVRVRKMTWLLVHIASFISVALAAIVAAGFFYGAHLFSHDAAIVRGVQALVLPVRSPCAARWHCSPAFSGMPYLFFD